MKLTKHQEAILAYVATRHPLHTDSATASRFAGDSFSQRSNGSWALPKLRALEKKGLLKMKQHQQGFSSKNVFVLNTENKQAFTALLKYGGKSGLTPREYLNKIREALRK